MSFKVGDKVRCKVGQGTVLEKGKIYEVLEIHSLDREIYLTLDGDGLDYPLRGWAVGRFERVIEPQEVKVGDVWASEDKKENVKMVGEFVSGDGSACLSYVHLNGYRKGRTWECLKTTVQELYPILVYREPPKQKKQPKPKQVKAKKELRAFGKDQFIFDVEYNLCPQTDTIYAMLPVYSFENFEGIARLKKGDKFDTFKGREIAAWKLIRNIANAKLDELCK